jgi:hypothetical protein
VRNRAGCSLAIQFALCGFDEARRNGAKYEAAISEAIRAVHSRCPDMLSRTEVKRIMAAERGSNKSGQTPLGTEDQPISADVATANAPGLPESYPERPTKIDFQLWRLPRSPTQQRKRRRKVASSSRFNWNRKVSGLATPAEALLRRAGGHYSQVCRSQEIRSCFNQLRGGDWS